MVIVAAVVVVEKVEKMEGLMVAGLKWWWLLISKKVRRVGCQTCEKQDSYDAILGPSWH